MKILANNLPQKLNIQEQINNLTADEISKWFADLKAVAFSGSYSDLSDRPVLGTSASQEVANNDTTTAAGYVADARIVKVHGDEIDELSTNLENLLLVRTGNAVASVAANDVASVTINIDVPEQYTIVSVTPMSLSGAHIISMNSIGTSDFSVIIRNFANTEVTVAIPYLALLAKIDS